MRKRTVLRIVVTRITKEFTADLYTLHSTQNQHKCIRLCTGIQCHLYINYALNSCAISTAIIPHPDPERNPEIMSSDLALQNRVTWFSLPDCSLCVYPRNYKQIPALQRVKIYPCYPTTLPRHVLRTPILLTCFQKSERLSHTDALRPSQKPSDGP